jgi:hypothetical protein
MAETLVVVSKIKKYVKEAGFRTGGELCGSPFQARARPGERLDFQS